MFTSKCSHRGSVKFPSLGHWEYAKIPTQVPPFDVNFPWVAPPPPPPPTLGLNTDRCIRFNTPQAAQARSESYMCTILRNVKMAVNIKDLYGNQAIDSRRLFSRSDAILAISFIPDLPISLKSHRIGKITTQ